MPFSSIAMISHTESYTSSSTPVLGQISLIFYRLQILNSTLSSLLLLRFEAQPRSIDCSHTPIQAALYLQSLKPPYLVISWISITKISPYRSPPPTFITSLLHFSLVCGTLYPFVSSEPSPTPFLHELRGQHPLQLLSLSSSLLSHFPYPPFSCIHTWSTYHLTRSL